MRFNCDPRCSPEQYAQTLAHELKVSYPVNPKDIVEGLGLLYREKDMGSGGGYDGCLIKRKAVLINSNIQYESRKNFTIAHELGHFVIKGHDKDIYNCSGKDIQAFYGQNQESEANRFAAEFLLPTNRVKDVLKRKPVTMELAMSLANEYGTSLTSTLMKLVKQTHMDLCVVILSENGRIKWRIPSSIFNKRFEIITGNLSSDTYAYDVFQGKEVSPEPKKVRPEAWFGRSQGLDHIIEETVPFIQLGLALTLITVPEEEEL